MSCLLPALATALLALLAVSPAADARHRCHHLRHCAAKTRPVGSPPLSDARAARRVKRARREPRPENAAANSRTPTRAEIAYFYAHSDMTYKRRVTGRFRGTTDEILQWAAHKHGVTRTPSAPSR